MNADPLTGLRPLHLPEPVDWWPPAPLWWLLALLALATLVAVARGAWHFYRRNRYRRAALGELRGLWRDAQRAERDGEFAANAGRLLRRAALARYGHARVAALTGEAWLAFLDHSARMQCFVHGPGKALAHAPYDPAASCDDAALEHSCRQWLRRHR